MLFSVPEPVFAVLQADWVPHGNAPGQVHRSAGGALQGSHGFCGTRA